MFFLFILLVFAELMFVLVFSDQERVGWCRLQVLYLLQLELCNSFPMVIQIGGRMVNVAEMVKESSGHVQQEYQNGQNQNKIALTKIAFTFNTLKRWTTSDGIELLWSKLLKDPIYFLCCFLKVVPWNYTILQVRKSLYVH